MYSVSVNLTSSEWLRRSPSSNTKAARRAALGTTLQSYVRSLRRAIPANPAKPLPRSSSDEGSGVKPGWSTLKLTLNGLASDAVWLKFSAAEIVKS